MMMQNLYQRRHSLLSRLRALTRSQPQFQRMNHNGVEGGVPTDMHSDSILPRRKGVDMSKWKRVHAKHLGIRPNPIPVSPWTVLNILRHEGFDAYLVGGCVRDLILDKVPKDFDIITTANLSQINKTFRHSIIIGRRFPICRVVMKGSVIEVSSFETVARHDQGKKKALFSKISTDCNKKDFILWRDSMKRDFTINSLFFDPFKNVIYDYANGMEDLRTLNLQTVIPARLSFQEDCARILRGIRIAGRLGFSISPDTETAIQELSSSIASLDKFRLMLEFNYMLSYGASKASIILLHKFNLLGVFLPFHAAYLRQQSTENSTMSSMMVMKLLFYLDRLVNCAQPCSSNLWLGVFAFHQALVICPQELLVIWAFASALYHGNLEEGLKFARVHAKLQDEFDPVILRWSESKSDDELAGEVAVFARRVQDCVSSYVNSGKLSKYMSKYPEFSYPDLVFVSKKAGSEAAQLFDVLAKREIRMESHKSCSIKRKLIIDYKKLGKGDLRETRFVLGKIILNTLSGGLVGTNTMEDRKRDISSVLESTTSKQGVNKKQKLATECLEQELKNDESRRRISKREGDDEPNRMMGEEAHNKGGLKDDEIVEENGAGSGNHLKKKKKKKKEVKDRREVEKIKLENKRDRHITLQNIAGEEGGSERPLSSLFR
ncbi:Poly(A) polymerase I [Linum grandiflorum]